MNIIHNMNTTYFKHFIAACRKNRFPAGERTGWIPARKAPRGIPQGERKW